MSNQFIFSRFKTYAITHQERDWGSMFLSLKIVNLFIDYSLWANVSNNQTTTHFNINSNILYLCWVFQWFVLELPVWHSMVLIDCTWRLELVGEAGSEGRRTHWERPHGGRVMECVESCSSLCVHTCWMQGAKAERCQPVSWFIPSAFCTLHTGEWVQHSVQCWKTVSWTVRITKMFLHKTHL